MDEAELARVVWRTGDIADGGAVAAVVAEHRVRAIIHLAALQVPFCKADPVAGARANVVGTVNVLEAARHHGPEGGRLRELDRGGLVPAEGALAETLYGAYKLANELTARVYHQDWGTPSVGIRPGVVYGVGRDQGLTSKTTIAILAAAAGRPTRCRSPARSRRCTRARSPRRSSGGRRGAGRAVVFDLNGRATSVAEWLDILRAIAPGAARDGRRRAAVPGRPVGCADPGLPRRLRPGAARGRHPRDLRRLPPARRGCLSPTRWSEGDPWRR